MGGSDHVQEHGELTRRYFCQLGCVAAAAWNASQLSAASVDMDRQLQEAIDGLEYLTSVARGRYIDKGNTRVLELAGEKLREIGLVPETWFLEVVADTASSSVVERPLTRAQGTALDWNGLMKLAEKHAVRFIHPCICVNGDDPFHNSVWEGVPLREIIWLVKPKANIRRVYYQSYHPQGEAPFQASLPLGQVLETPPGQIPVVLAYKMNGEFIPAARGGPARIVVAGAYGDKSIKWVQRVVLTNDFKANDSDAADFNADVETAMKTKARFIHAPKELPAGKPAALTGLRWSASRGSPRFSTAYTPRRSSGRPTIPTGPEPIGRTRPFCPLPATGAEGCRAASFPPPQARWIRRQARRSSGRCDSLSSTGRHCSPACRPARTTCAAVASTATASLNHCRARC